MNLFPLYIQCPTHKDSEDVLKIHDSLLKLYETYSGGIPLAHAIYRSLNCSTIMGEVSPWYVLLNGRSFRGILYSTRFVLLYFIAIDVLIYNLQ